VRDIPTPTEIEAPTVKETPVTAARPAAEIRPARSRAAFTLVELLVVIGIIALLAALITPAVIGARTSARNAAIKAEIDMLHMAIMNYKNEYGSFPPCLGGQGDIVAAKHVQRLFPRMVETPADLVQRLNTLAPPNAIVKWLAGYSDDPTRPITGGNIKKLYDFDQTRIVGESYAPSGKPGSPYLYIDSTAYSQMPYTPALVQSGGVGAHFLPLTPPPTGTAADFTNSSQPFLNPDTFQILCAGLDETFGTDDDLSNCWTGTRKQYLDSLKK
jgi:prepilin-type N-terminal cleavage/methylation domain-containing protein